MKTFTIMLAQDHPHPSEACSAAFALHTAVRQAIAEPLPVLLLPKSANDFRPDNTLLAVCSGRVVGASLLNALPPVDADLTPVAAKFGRMAVRTLQKHLSDRQFELGSIAVCPANQRRGIGRAFYREAAAMTGGRCLAVINMANEASRHAASAAGYKAVAGDRHTVNFRLDGRTPVPDPAGRHVQHADIFVPAYGRP